MLQDANETILKPVWINTVIEQIVLQKGIPLDNYALCDAINRANESIREMGVNFNPFDENHKSGFKLKVYSELVARTKMPVTDCMKVGTIIKEVFDYQFQVKSNNYFDKITPSEIPDYNYTEFSEKFMSFIKNEDPISSN